MSAGFLKRAVWWLAVVALAGGCAGHENPHPPSPLPKIKTAVLKGKLLWSTHATDGAGPRVSGFTLAVDGRRVYTAGRYGTVSALELKNGDYAWQVDTERRLIAGPTVADGKLLLGTRDGRILALSAKDGSELWHADVASAVLSAPVVAKGIVVVRTLDGHLIALSLDDGSQIWDAQRDVPTLTIRGTSSPLIVANTVIAGLDNGKVVALDLDNGQQRWQQTVAAPSGRTDLERVVDIDANLLAVGGDLYAASIGGKLVSIAVTNGRLRWSRNIASRTGITFDPGQVFVTSLDGHVHSIDRNSGAPLWDQDALAYRNLSPPVMYRSYVTVLDYQGYLHWMIPEDGTIVGRAHPVDSAVRATPVVVGDKILILATDGTVAALKGVYTRK